MSLNKIGKNNACKNLRKEKQYALRFLMGYMGIPYIRTVPYTRLAANGKPYQRTLPHYKNSPSVLFSITSKSIQVLYTVTHDYQEPKITTSVMLWVLWSYL